MCVSFHQTVKQCTSIHILISAELLACTHANMSIPVLFFHSSFSIFKSQQIGYYGGKFPINC